MPKSNLQMVLEENHSRFFIHIILNNPEPITQWVEENLINDNPNTNAQSKIAFYEAEKSLIIKYIAENKFDRLSTLINAVDHEKFSNNQKLKLNECRVLANAIIEAQKYRCVREDGNAIHSDLNKLLRTKYQELTDESYKSKISEIVDQALLIVCHEPSKAVTTMGDDGASDAVSSEIENNNEDCNNIDDILFKKYIKEIQLSKNTFVREKVDDPTYKVLPQFYFVLPRNHESIAQKLREEARALFLQKRSKELLNNIELKALWKLLEKHHSLPTVGEEQFITYDNFLKVTELSCDKVKHYLTATVFARLLSISSYPGRASIMSLFNYTMRKVWLQQTRIGLSLYDYTGQGYLRETDLESYIMELIPTLPHLEGLERSFHSFYVCTAVRKFFFFLDPLKTGNIKIREILTCNFLDDLLELKDEELPKDAQEVNWFSAPSALSVYGHYLNLDKDHNGMLSKKELSGYGSGTLTTIFLDRVFAECLTYDGEMDYKTYLDFVLALENRHEPQSLHYLFRILDFEHNGYLTAFNLNYFYKGIQEQIAAHRAETVNFEDVKDEIFDMVKPEDPSKIYLKDLIDCGQGDTMISILIEFHKFWAYENREVMVADNPSHEEVEIIK